MTRFVPFAVADTLSQALWGLSRPPHVRDENDTQFLFSWITDLTGGRWLMVQTDYDIAVHPDAELNGIADILQPWIDAGHLTPDTNTQLAALVESLRGQRLVVYAAFPQLFKDMSKTREQMVALGLLPEPTPTP